MNILWIYSTHDVQSFLKPLWSPIQIHSGISHIIALLKKYGHNVKLIVLSRVFKQRSRQLIDKYARHFKPRLICFTAVSPEYLLLAEIAKYLKTNYPEIYLLIGGVHASLNPEDVLRDDFDAICIGEGEYPTLELVRQLEENRQPSGIANLWIKNNLEIERNPARPFLHNLDELPFLDREIWNEWMEEKQIIDLEPILVSRGCPFECSYCCNHALRRLAHGCYVRFRSPENIIEEIKTRKSIFPQKRGFYFESETMNVNKDWVLDFCKKLESFNRQFKKPLYFGTNVRVTPSSNLKEIFFAFKKSNFVFINIGLESGSERLRRTVLKRNYSNKDIIGVVRLAKKYSLRVHLNNMVGLPGETWREFQETVKLNRICQPDRLVNYIFYPYPGTDLYNYCKEKGLRERFTDVEIDRCQPALDLPGFSKREIQKAYIWMDYYVYRGYKPLVKIFSKVFIRRIQTTLRFNYIYRYICGFIFRFKFFRLLYKKMHLYDTL